jgi:3-isopropylmalate/(R)-2-methylmalate dehydratase small subunit
MTTKTAEQGCIEGNVWRVGNNVNTESITPSRWLHEGGDIILDHIGEILIPEFPKKVRQGDIWVGGSNLGCSSSRNAPFFLKKKGISAVLCFSASRIFYRNAINAGLPIFDIGKEVEKLHMGDRVQLNIYTGEIKNLTTGEQLKTKPYPDFIMKIVEAGGIANYIKSRKSEYKLLK